MSYIITNDVLKCPSIHRSSNQIDGDERGNYLRSGAYGYNWATFGPFHGDGASASLPRTYPVNQSVITHAAQAIVTADAYGDAAQTENVHAYTLDGPTQLNGRWGTNASQCPADPRHLDRFEALFADGHAEELRLREAGYDADFPEDVSGTGDPTLWNGVGDSSVSIF